MFFSQALHAETYIREYIYKASEADSKLTSRTIALDQVKIILLQEIGTHIRQKIKISKDSSGSTYASEDIEAITAGLTTVEILDEKWDGVSYYLKAKIEADEDKVLDALNEFKNTDNQETLQYLEALKANQKILKVAREDIEKLKHQLKDAKDEKHKRLSQSNYVNEVNKLSAAELFEKGALSDKSGQYIDAAYWYHKAEEKGSVLAQNNLGAMYNYGQGVKQDYSKAVTLFRKAAKNGSDAAQYNLCLMYINGNGVSINNELAFSWCNKSAEQGFDEAQHTLGWIYEMGRGVKQDYQQAKTWYSKAADQGLARAQNDLHRLHLGIRE